IIASGMLIYSNTTNVTAVNPSTNSLIWSANALTITMSSQFLAYGNKLYVGGSLPGSGNKGVFAFYLNNGTQAWSLNLGAAAGTLAMDQGSLVAETSSNIYIIDDVGSSAGTILTVPESSPYGLSVSGANGAIAFMSSIGANAISANGIGYGGFPYSTATASTSPAIYNGSMAYQGASATMLAYSSNGIQAWSKAIPSAYGSAISGNPVILSSSLMYTAWSNGYLVAQNLSTGSIAWATGVPYAGSSLYLYALAYGRLYVRDGNYIIAYGACSSGNSASILSSAASLYSNGQAGCADALVDGVAPMQNYSIFLNGTFAPSMNLATFTGTNSYAENPSTAPLNNLQTFTISGWVYPTSYSLATQGPYIYSEGQPATTMVLNILPSGSLYGATWNQGTWNSISGLSVPLNTWSFVAFSLGIGGKTGTYSLYLNNQRITSPGQPEESSPTTYSAIGVEVGSLVGQPNDYFSGGIANLQIYNETLTQGQVAQIYQGGIQSSPLQGTGLQAWYPLAGDTNDYSGLAGHTMYPVNVLFSAGNYLPIGYSNSYQLSKATQLIPVTNSITGLSRLYNVGVISWH
ncbi:MAG: PQQ-binding-like beta-propeller repeat protein, partial [Candidatus Micrarchaeota archaeon]|nr:PQQ-binding-like beta-propeller repeat protein [Candidatus Micrarchaeota archaeon]